MGQTAQQIEAHIEHSREDLGSNLHELETKVKSVTDWKYHFRTKPMTMLGVAFGGGILLATMLGGRKHRLPILSGNAAGSEPHRRAGPQTQRCLDAWDNIKEALIGVAATRFTDFVGDVVPGFQEQLHRTGEKARTS